MKDQLPAVSLDDLEHVEEPIRGTRAINKIKRRHGADLRIELGRETASGGTWLNFKVRGDVVAAMDYFAGSSSKRGPQEGATFYIHPDYL